MPWPPPCSCYLCGGRAFACEPPLSPALFLCMLGGHIEWQDAVPMNLRDLEYLVALEEEKHFRKAAGVASSVSRP